MTNTGDFRRYSYQSDASYALKAFDVSRSSAAPAYPQPKKQPLKVRESGGKKSRMQLLKEQKAAALKAIIIFGVALAVIGMLYGVLHTYAAKNELNHEISSLETELSVAESENTRINSELNALVSMNMIDQYAVEKLGMTKIQSSQIKYIDVSEFREAYRSPAQKLLEKDAGQ